MKNKLNYSFFLIPLVAVYFFSALPVQAAIISGTGTEFSSYVPGTTNFSVAVAPGSNTALIVTMAVNNSSSGVSVATYGGVALTKLWDKADGCNCGLNLRSSAWILINPPTGTNTLSITWTGSDIAGFAQPWYGVSQAGGVNGSWRTPVTASDGGSGSATASTNISNAQSGDAILDVVAIYNQTPNADASQTVSNQQNNVFGNHFYFGTSNKFASGATTMQWTMTSTYWAMGAVALIPAGGGAPDTTPPSAPTGLSATTVSSSQINLLWAASIDNVEVTSYTIYRGGAQIGTSATNSYSDTGLSPSTQYTYTVSAQDSTGNSSAQSTSASATTQSTPAPDTQAPTIPTNLSATAISSSAINLSWTASTDNIGVTGYRIERCTGTNCTTFVQTSTPTANSYSDTSLTASTVYRYQARATDAAGNLSGYSSIVSATTQASAPPPSSGCSGSGTIWSCAAGATISQVQSAINNASNGATITFANGNYTWSGTLALSNTKGITLICVNQGACTISGNGTLIGMPQILGTNINLYRISGFIFTGTGSGGFTIWFGYSISANGELTQVRIDHNTFNLSSGATAIFIGDTGGISNVYGVIDHNILNSSGTVTLLMHIGNTDTSPPPSSSGTANNLFVEDNIINITTATNAGQGCVDLWGGAAAVWRYNTTTNCLVTMHGVTHGGGPHNFELYNNNLKVNSGAVSQGLGDGYRLFHHQGSGEFMAFNNNFTAYSGKSGDALEMTHYRSASPSIAGYNASLGQCNGASSIDGNRSPASTYFGYPCWRQPGRDFAGNLMPMYIWNNKWSDTGTKIDMAVETPWGNTNPSVADHIKSNRDYYNAVSASAQTSPISPFNGTTGMGFGTLANRPTTCSIGLTDPADAGKGGVGYFATDVGSQGTLYRCSSTNTWVVHYTPYTYPHPLVAGAVTPPSDTTPPSVPGTPALSVISSSQINLTWTASTDNVGVTGYRVERCSGTGCSNFTQIATPSTNSYSDTSLSANTVYIYRVRATDLAGNLSSYSSSSSATTQSGQPVPGDLNSDHIVNALDYSLLNSKWLQSFSAYDLQVDGLINSLDFAILSSNWGKTW